MLVWDGVSGVPPRGCWSGGTAEAAAARRNAEIWKNRMPIVLTQMSVDLGGGGTQALGQILKTNSGDGGLVMSRCPSYIAQ